VNAFNENARVSFFVWTLDCVPTADHATAILLGNGALQSFNTSSIPPHTAFPFTTNEPKNQIESNWDSLLEALLGAEGDPLTDYQSGTSWLETTLRSLLVEQPNITTLEDNLASISSLAYALLIQRWRIRYAGGDTTLASTWVPQNATVAGEVPVLKAHLQINGTPLLVGSLSVLVLGAVSVMCVTGHDTTDDIMHDGGVIDLISLLHNSALPEMLVGHGEDGGNQRIGSTMFGVCRNRARRAMVALVIQIFRTITC
jgi:hypothetical protein